VQREERTDGRVRAAATVIVVVVGVILWFVVSRWTSNVWEEDAARKAADIAASEAISIPCGPHDRVPFECGEIVDRPSDVRRECKHIGRELTEGVPRSEWYPVGPVTHPRFVSPQREGWYEEHCR
jgi:hypothetical protein